MNLSNIQLDKQKKLLIVIFSVLIIYVDLSYILKAQISGVNSLNPKVLRLENDLKNLNRGLENMRIAKSKPTVAIGEKQVVKSSKILTEGQVSGLLQDISTEANKLDVKIIQMRPSRQTQLEKSAIPGDKIIPLLINLDLICDYHSLGKFVNSLENSAVFMGIAELKISTQPKDYLKQKVTLVIKTYVVK